MLMLKVCYVCDAILGEIETEDLTAELPETIMAINGNVAYTLCSECKKELEPPEIDWIRH